jgi:HK97 family phage major capsid protein
VPLGDGGDPFTAEEYKEAFWAHMRAVRQYGQEITPRQREILMRGLRQPEESRAQSIGTPSGGGYLVPQGFYNAIQTARKLYGGMRMGPTFKIQTETGNPLPIPTADDTGNVGAILAENTQITTQDVAFGSVTLNGYTYTSKLILVSWQLMQDSAFDLETFLSARMGERIGRAENAHFTTGDGTGKPTGILTSTTLGVTAAATSAVTYDELIDMEHSVDPVYRVMPGVAWMFNDTTLKAFRKLKDGDDRPIWLPAATGTLAAGVPDLLLNHPYIINQDMPAMTTGLKPVTFGDMSNYWIRDVREITIIRLDERYADYLQSGFFAFSRVDGKLIDAGAHPVKHLLMA